MKLAMRRAMLCLLLCACGSSGRSPDGGGGFGVCPAGTQTNSPCTVSGRCYTASPQCGPGTGDTLRECTCNGTSYDCTDAPVAQGVACEVPEGTSCAVEGHPSCDVPPTSGSCSCQGGHWACSYACPMHCPPQQPGQGAACEILVTEPCPYGDPVATYCSCQGGAYRCCPGQPCPAPDAGAFAFPFPVQ